MRKITLLLALAAFAVTPTIAMAKKKTHAAKSHETKPHEMTFDEAMAYNKKNLSLLVQGLPLVLPSWSLPVYFSMQDNNQPQHGKHKKR